MKFFKKHHAKYADWGLVYWLFSAEAVPLTRCADCGMPKGLRGLRVSLPHCKTVLDDANETIQAWVKKCNPFIFNICNVCMARFQSIGATLRHLS